MLPTGTHGAGICGVEKSGKRAFRGSGKAIPRKEGGTAAPPEVSSDETNQEDIRE